VVILVAVLFKVSFYHTILPEFIVLRYTIPVLIVSLKKIVTKGDMPILVITVKALWVLTKCCHTSA